MRLSSVSCSSLSNVALPVYLLKKWFYFLHMHTETTDPRHSHSPPKFSPLSLSLKNLLPPFPVDFPQIADRAPPIFGRTSSFSGADQRFLPISTADRALHFRCRPITARLQGLHFLLQGLLLISNFILLCFPNWQCIALISNLLEISTKYMEHNLLYENHRHEDYNDHPTEKMIHYILQNDRINKIFPLKMNRKTDNSKLLSFILKLSTSNNKLNNQNENSK